MPFSVEELEQLGAFVASRAAEVVEAELAKEREKEAAAAPQRALEARVATVGTPDVDPEAGPEFYVHLSTGAVVTTHDSQSTHLTDPTTGETAVVIGRYQKGV